VLATGATYGDLITYSAYNGYNLWVNSKTLNGNYTINGNLTVTGNTTLTTISATTYQNLPLDIRVTGGTYSTSASTITFRNNTGGTFNVTGITATGGGSFTGGTVTGATFFTGGLSANTISATTYQNLPRDVFVTGGTYNTGTSTITFRNSTGGTFSVTGITAGSGSGGTGTVSGTVNYVAKFTGSTGVGNSIIYDDGTYVGIGTASPAKKLDVNGDAIINTVIVGLGALNDTQSTVVGANGLANVSTGGINNTVYGYNSGADITTGKGNLLIGNNSRYRPDGGGITTESYNLNITKDNATSEGYPHFWSPQTVSVDGSTNAPILTLNPNVYSALFLDYFIEDKDSGAMRAGTIKGVWKIDLSIIEWSEENAPEIGDTTFYVFDLLNDSGSLVVKLTNNNSQECICNYTSRLILRHYI
jgi:hypothetical protein